MNSFIPDLREFQVPDKPHPFDSDCLEAFFVVSEQNFLAVFSSAVFSDFVAYDDFDSP